MSKMSLAEQCRLREALKVVLSFVDNIPVDKTCRDCLHFDRPMCKKFDQRPPPRVVEAGCDSFEYDGLPF